MKEVLKRLFLGPPGLRPRRILSGLNRGKLFNIDSVNRSQRILGLDERELFTTVQNWSKWATFAVDVGANDGWYALYFASQPTIEKVVAVEPDVKLVEKMTKNFMLNDLAWNKKLHVYQCFVGDEEKNKTFKTLDNLVPISYDKIILKIDIEGSEYSSLLGAQRLLTQRQTRWIVEVHSEYLERQCEDYFRSKAYITKIIKAAWYRKIFPEQRIIEHNRWLLATKQP